MKSDTFWAWFDAEARPHLIGRADTFVKMFEHLDRFDGPVTIVETGCSRRDPAIEESWQGDGCSTVLFDRYAASHPGSHVYSVDIDPAAVAEAGKNVGSATTVACCDSIVYLKLLAKGEVGHHIVGLTVHLLYLDSFDFTSWDPLPSAIHHHAELMASMPMIRPETLVVIDDSPATLDGDQRAEVGGKGLIVARHMMLCGADMAFCSYQTGWLNVAPARKRVDADLTTLVERARTHVEADDAVSAEQLYRLILGITTPPISGAARVAHGEACAFYAKMALARQRLGAAADWYREALMADPLATDYRLELCTKCFMPMGNLDSALLEAKRATQISPTYATAWKLLGGIHHEMNNAEKASAAYEEQLSLDPMDPEALLDRATIALDTADYDKVREVCGKVMGTDREADAIHCLAMVAYREHEHEEAIVLFDRAIALGCRDPATAHWNKSLALHSIGRYAEGWIEHEHREHQRSNPAMFLPMIRFTLPRWKGEPPIKDDGSKVIIHVHYEAGAGDNLCMVRYLTMLTERGYQVRYECADELVDLMRSSMPWIEVVPKAKDYPGALGIMPFDYHIPIGSLPAVLGTDIDSVPWAGPYLKADPILVSNMRAKLPKNTRTVGICWSSGIREGIWMKEYGMRKSMHFNELTPIISRCLDLDMLAVGLQVGPERSQIDKYLPASVFKDVLPARPSWGETAALIECLDLVITVDTAIAHLAGAMGKPVWLMCQRDACSWHFMCWRPGASWNEASPWYPSTRVFRQRNFNQPHIWSDVTDTIAEELEQWKTSQPAPAE
jgi:hypothetical protein